MIGELIGKIYWQRIISGDGNHNHVEATRGDLAKIKLTDISIEFIASYEDLKERVVYNVKLNRDHLNNQFEGSFEGHSSNGVTYIIRVTCEVYSNSSGQKFVLFGNWHDVDTTYEFHCSIVKIPS